MPFNLHMTTAPIALFGLGIFTVAMALVMAEEFIMLRKSKPMVFAAGILWMLVAMAAHTKGMSDQIEGAIRHYIEEYAQLFLFLFVAMTYINAMEERGVFNALRGWLTEKRFSYRQLFWITGILAFFISPIADNMTTALILCAIVLAVGKDQPRFISIACINIVVAANSGGAFSPFGDITTLMVWQKDILPFQSFFNLFVPCVVNFLVPAAIMHFAIPKALPAPIHETIRIQPGGMAIVVFFLLTILTSILLNHFYNIPPAIGMMTGFAYLQLFSYYLKLKYSSIKTLGDTTETVSFDIFEKIRRLEWDTLLFFYGVILCIGALGTFGYLELASNTMYAGWGQTNANVAIGVLSAIIDNIPLMFAVLTVHPVMSEGQWLLLTLTTGVGGSILSIGSAAGVALMGQSKGNYTFMSHLRWSWAILLGYGASILTHMFINRPLF
jgi:Na+/H+ antiporter NhaD/arsenite permease-like protein